MRKVFVCISNIQRHLSLSHNRSLDLFEEQRLKKIDKRTNERPYRPSDNRRLIIEFRQKIFHDYFLLDR